MHRPRGLDAGAPRKRPRLRHRRDFGSDAPFLHGSTVIGSDSPFARRLGLFSATMVVVSGIIGGGIFINPHLVAETVHTPFLILAAWIAGGVISLAGAFVFAELGTVLPRVGGQYAFFREAFHPLVAFLHGWTLLLVIESGAMAAIAVALAEYVARLTHPHEAPGGPVAPVLLLGLPGYHAVGIRPGAGLVDVIPAGQTP